MKQSEPSDMKTRNMMTAVLSVIVAVSSCIKEDRSECPCRLVLDFSDIDTDVISAAAVSMTSADGFAYSEDIDRSDFDEYMVTVPRTEIEVNIWAGAGHLLNDDMSVVIPYGEDCPRVFLHESVLMTDCELVEEKVILKKNHCVLTVQVEKGGDYPFDLTVKGRVDGYGSDFRPSVGEFSCRTQPDSLGRCVVVLPRQLDSSLMLEVDDGSESVKTFAIGESVVAGGYDWNAGNLDDVTVMLDYSLTEVTLEIEEWNDEKIYDVVI